MIYMIRANVRLRITWRSNVAGLPAKWDFMNSYTIYGRGGMPRTDRAVTTCHHPLNHGISSYLKIPMYPGTMPAYKVPTHVPPGLQPYGLTS